MKALFLLFHGFEEFNGISKKVRYQVSALEACGMEVHTCWLDDDHNHKRRMVDDNVLCDYGNGLSGKIRKRTGLGCIARYVNEERIGFVYIRYDHNANPWTIALMRKLRKSGARIVMEIPTYPYDNEYKGLPAPYQRILLVDKCFRKRLARYVDYIVTFSDEETIWNCPTIRISNGIDFGEIGPKTNGTPAGNEVHLIAVATMHPWHGFDRAIRGLANYYAAPHTEEVYLHVVGYGVPQVVEGYQRLVEEHGLEGRVVFHEALYGSALDALFEQSHIGIGSLARHRSGIDCIKTLKNREYAARGIPFVYSETDSDFEQMPYVLKAPPDETPLDIGQLLRFYRSADLDPQRIRATIEQRLSWQQQMQKVIDRAFSKT